MERKIKVAQIGCGKMSKLTMRYVYEKGAEITLAFDVTEDKFGLDIGSIMETENKGVVVEDIKNLESRLKEDKPDIAIVTTMSLLSDLESVLRTCAKCGVNAITTCEEAFYASNSNPKLFRELDSLFKSTGATLTGCGYQDIFWGGLISTLASSTHKITKIKGSSSYNVEDYGIALAKAHGAGLTLEEFDRDVASNDRISDEERQKIIESGEFAPSYMWNVAGWLIEKLGLHITSINQKCVPMTNDEDIYSSTLDMTVKAGDATGMSAIVTAHTEEGITIEAECIGKVYNKDEFDVNEWSIIGEPETTLVINKPCTVELTCADIVNRIPDVINARSGFIATCELPESTYRVKPLNEYIEKE
jgi:4-hydroxy-tetrahydrodipicolinate reductase